MAESSIQSSQRTEHTGQIEYPGRLSIEDCICPICLDYFIDVVETRCHHRFCKYCLENWLHVSFRRQCPTCRTAVGAIQVLPQLQEAIDSTLLPVLSNDAVLERIRVRNERLAQMDRMAAEREQEQSLLSRISFPIHHYPGLATLRQGRLGENELGPHSSPASVNLLSRRILNWWDDNNPTIRWSSEPANAAPARLIDEIEIEEMSPNSQRLHVRIHGHPARTNDLLVEGGNVLRTDRNMPGASSDSRAATATPPNSGTGTNLGAVGPAQGNNSRPPGASHNQYDNIYEESLLEEYTFHLRRSQSAYTRIREGYRDFNYHNTRMQQILDEHRIFTNRNPQNSASEPIDSLDTGNVDYEDYDDIMEAELREIGNAMHVPIVYNIVSPDNGQMRDRLQNLQSRVQTLLHSVSGFRNRRPSTATTTPNVSFRRDPAPPPFRERPIPEENNMTNVLDMEQELQTRTSQLNGIFSGSRRLSSISGTGRLPNSMSTRGLRAQTPVRSPQPPPSHLLSPIELQTLPLPRLRPSSAQHHLLVERIQGRTAHTVADTRNLINDSNISGITPSRRMRRRVIRGDLIRQDEMNNNMGNNNPPNPDILTVTRPQTSPSMPESENRSSPTNIGNSNNSSFTSSMRNHARVGLPSATNDVPNSTGK